MSWIDGVLALARLVPVAVYAIACVEEPVPSRPPRAWLETRVVPRSLPGDNDVPRRFDEDRPIADAGVAGSQEAGPDCAATDADADADAAPTIHERWVSLSDEARRCATLYSPSSCYSENETKRNACIAECGEFRRQMALESALESCVRGYVETQGRGRADCRVRFFAQGPHGITSREQECRSECIRAGKKKLADHAR